MKIHRGVIVLAYKSDPQRFLLIRNRQTEKLTPIAGGVEIGESLKQAAVRELKEEANWNIDESQLIETEAKHRFVYGSQKKDRTGQKTENTIFLLNADDLPNPQNTSDAHSHLWLDKDKFLSSISFEDLRPVLKKVADDIECNNAQVN